MRFMILVKADRASEAGTPVKFSGGKRTVVQGPFAATEELVAGFWLWRVGSMAEAIEWVKRAPFDDGAEIEIRPLLADEDFGPAFTPELREREERMRAQVAERKARVAVVRRKGAEA